MTTGTLNQQQLKAAERQAVIARIAKAARRVIAYGLMALLGFIFLFPIIFMVVAAFKPNERVIADLASVRAFLPNPNQLTTANIQDVFSRVEFELLMFNSVFITLVTVIGGLFVNSMAAYVLARLRWLGRALVLSVIISLIIIPLEAIAVPLMMQVNQINVLMSLLALFITGMLMVIMFVIVWQTASKMLFDSRGISMRILISVIVLLFAGLLNALRSVAWVHELMLRAGRNLGLFNDLSKVSLSEALAQNAGMVVGWCALILITWAVLVLFNVYARTRRDTPKREALTGTLRENIQTVVQDRTLFNTAVDRFLTLVLTLFFVLPFEIMFYMVFKSSVVFSGGLLSQDLSIAIRGGSWLNSYHVQILPFIAEPFSIFLFYQFFISVPKDFDEAAYVDGAGPFRIYWQIMVPLSRPVFATVAILKFLQFWQFYMWPLMVTRGDNFQPLMVGMGYFQTQAPIKWGSIMGYAAMVTIPVLITFLLFQKWFVQSVSSSGVKG